MRALPNIHGSRSEKDKDAHDNIAQSAPPQKFPPISSIAATPGPIESHSPPPELPSGLLPPSKLPSVTELSESSTSTGSSSTTTTTTATTVGANDNFAFASLLSLPSAGIVDNAPVQRTFQSSTPYSQSHATDPTSRSEFTDDDPVDSQERTYRKILCEIVLSEDVYVRELTRIKKTFVNPLLHAFSPTSGSPQLIAPHSGTSHPLPEDLRICLEVIENDILENHTRFSKALKAHWVKQSTPLQSVEVVLVEYSYILTGYNEYMLHLERAVEQLNGPEGNTEEELVISLAKPFHWLLKHHLFLQYLLFCTNLVTSDYDGVLKMIIEIETIIGGIEDERIQKKHHHEVWDVLRRIDGLDKVKELAVPNPTRLLVRERKTRTSLRDSGGGETDLWLVVFNDVVLRCQRTDAVSLPTWGASWTTTIPITVTRATVRPAITVRRQPPSKLGNLYKFLKIETWDVHNFVRAYDGDIVIHEVPPSRALGASVSSVSSRSVPLLLGAGAGDGDDEESDGASEFDRKTKSTSSTWGGDKIAIHKPPFRRPRRIVPTESSVPRKPITSASVYDRQSPANTEFSTRRHPPVVA